MNTVLFTLSEPNAIQAVKRLHDEGKINICAWLGTDKGQGVIEYDYGRLNDYTLLKAISKPCPKDIYDRVYEHIYRFLDMVFRNGDKPIYEYVGQFNLWLNFYYGLFTRYDAELVMFGDNPHYGVDSIAKDLADAMGLKTVLFMQAHESNRFFAFTRVSDVGEFITLPNDDAIDISVEEKYEKDLYYMKNIKIVPPGENVENNGFSRIKHLPKKIWQNRGQIFYKGIKKVCSRLGKSSRTKLAKIEYRHCEHMLTVADVDFDKKFVYFPLHLQPEMTTSALGGKFCDQILAIERLRQMLPDDYVIYVKENPKQSYYMRDVLFYERLRLLDNVYLVSRRVNTYDLIRKSLFVATITGTAGWEAISGGKCVLIFGLAWYRKMPGVFEYAHDFKLEDILSYRINHSDVENAYARLLSRSYKGVLECGGQGNVPNYSDAKNNEYLYNAFCKILQQINNK